MLATCWESIQVSRFLENAKDTYKLFTAHLLRIHADGRQKQAYFEPERIASICHNKH